MTGASSTKIDCSQSHDSEVTAVLASTAFADDPVKRASFRNFTCLEQAGKYIGGPGYGTLLVGNYVTSSVDKKADSRIVCTVREYKDDDSGVQMQTTTLKNAIKTNGFDKYKFCTSELPSGPNVKLTTCSGPHVAETVWGYTWGPFGAKFPGTAQQAARAMKACTPYATKYLGATRSDVVPSQNSAPESNWVRGNQLTACFVQTNGTKITKSLKGIGSKPLSSVQ
ncbi:septum formation family protein [Calidifontibacter terrae]